MYRLRARPLAALLLSFVLAGSTPVLAADLGAGVPLPLAPPDQIEVDVEQATADYLRRYAVLLGIRATFQVIAEDAVLDELIAEADRLNGAGPTEGDLAALDGDLLSEGSYYLVSLRYLVLGGGAAWPGTKDESTYVNDSLLELETLENDLIAAIADRTDPLEIFQRGQHILSLTEGYDETPGERDRFAGRSELIEAVMADFGPRTST